MKNPYMVMVVTAVVGTATIVANAASFYLGYHAIADGGLYYWGMFVIISTLAGTGKTILDWLSRE